MNQLFLPDIHILPNKVSLIQTRDKTGLIHWFSDAQVQALMEVEHVKKYGGDEELEKSEELEPEPQLQLETDGNEWKHFI